MMRQALLTTLLALLAVLTRHSSSAQGGYFPGASIKGTKGGGYYPYPPNPYPPNPYPYPYPTPSPIIPKPADDFAIHRPGNSHPHSKRIFRRR
uniref:Putative secreted protein n=1 Tax=Rhipicephalus microplus TaxID=6941 RepID=A0A6G5A1E6_RHIMP